jgi:aryl-alcohol dehydrogenase-like predicted oxidoreductase
MEQRRLGRSDLQVSALALGTMTFGAAGRYEAAGSVDIRAARRQLDLALDASVTFVDTANAYSAGRSEEVLGEILAGRRDRVVLATKGGMPMGDGPEERGLSRAHVLEQCDASLRRLRTDWIDLYQVHAWDGLTPLPETLEALQSLVASGKVRRLGCSNFSAWHLLKAQAIAGSLGLEPFISEQVYYSLLGREAEYELIPAAIDQGLGVIVWSPLAGGLLSGKYRRGGKRPANARTWPLPPVADEERLYAIVDELDAVALARGATPAQIAISWLLSRPGVSTVLIGARTEEQLRANLAAAELRLEAGELERLDGLTRLPLLYPYWLQARATAPRLGDADLALHRQWLGKDDPGLSGHVRLAGGSYV